MFLFHATRGHIYTKYPTILSGMEDILQTCWDTPIDSWDTLVLMYL